MKGKTKGILLFAVVKWRHRANGLLAELLRVGAWLWDPATLCLYQTQFKCFLLTRSKTTETKFLPSYQLWSYHVSIHHIPDRMLENPTYYSRRKLAVLHTSRIDFEFGLSQINLDRLNGLITTPIFISAELKSKGEHRLIWIWMWSSASESTPVHSRYYKWAYATGPESKEDGKPCVTSVTIILFEKILPQISLSF